eukprot:TRINITY_DN9083_c0_g1_i1.p2 TRINITY_DN9083_c0_g1~~TRINITY_DN9083_c0_g1_i1.p2  ORF type:complete len:197 (+),score=64.03 TRINITY_DN9083_c0_g1_i1:711-1301(+)
MTSAHTVINKNKSKKPKSKKRQIEETPDTITPPIKKKKVSKKPTEDTEIETPQEDTSKKEQIEAIREENRLLLEKLKKTKKSTKKKKTQRDARAETRRKLQERRSKYKRAKQTPEEIERNTTLALSQFNELLESGASEYSDKQLIFKKDHRVKTIREIEQEYTVYDPLKDKSLPPDMEQYENEKARRRLEREKNFS